MVDDVNRAEMAQNFGFALSFFRSDDELWKLFNQAVKQTWTADRFIARLRGTDWFKKHSSAVRNSIMQQTADPASYQAAVDQMYATVKDAYGQMFGDAGVGDKQLRAWAETAHRLGWSQAQLLDRVTHSMNFKKLLKSKALGGSAATTEGQLKALSQAYGVDLGDNWRAQQVKRIMAGDDTIEGVQARVRELAMREYKAFSDAISSGQTVQEIADPYMQKMASMLELNPADIGINNKLIQKALKQRTADGKPAAMDLNDFEDMIRKDGRWQYTDNAREEMSSVVAQLATAFGRLA